MKKIIIVLQLSLMLVSINAFSQTSTFPQTAERALIGKFLIEGGYEYGGDEILNGLTAAAIQGDDLVKAGQGAFLAVGGQLEFSKLKLLMLRASIGIKYHRVAFEDGTVQLTKIPVRLMSYIKIDDNFRFGIGVTTDTKIRLKQDGKTLNSGYESLVGSIFELGYKWLAITYTSLSYVAETDNRPSASSLGLSASFVFPKK